VLRDVIQATGKINSLPGLIARETHLLDPIVTSSRVLSEIGVRNLQFWDFVSRLDGVVMGAVWHQTPVADIWHSLFGIEVHRQFLGLHKVGAFAHSCELTTQDRDTFVDGETTLSELLEGASRLAEYHLLLPIIGGHAATTFLAAGSSAYWSSTAKACRVLDVPPYHQLIRVLHEIALEQFPDPELLAGSRIEALDWNLHYPGRFYDRALADLASVKIEPRMTLAKAYELIATVCLSRDAEPYLVARAAAASLGSPAELIAQRNRVSTLEYASRHVAEDGEILLDDFAGLTLSAGIAIRARDPIAFLKSADQFVEEIDPVLAATRLPPFVLTDQGFGCHACINADQTEHLSLLIDALFDLTIDELAESGRCRISALMYKEIVTCYGDDGAQAADFLLARRMGTPLAEMALDVLGRKP